MSRLNSEKFRLENENFEISRNSAYIWVIYLLYLVNLSTRTRLILCQVQFQLIVLFSVDDFVYLFDSKKLRLLKLNYLDVVSSFHIHARHPDVTDPFLQIETVGAKNGLGSGWQWSGIYRLVRDGIHGPVRDSQKLFGPDLGLYYSIFPVLIRP